MKNKKQKFFALLFALFFYSSPLLAKDSINDVLFKIEPTIVTLYAYGDNNFSIKREDLIQKSFGKIQVDHFLNGYTDQLTDPADKFDEEKLSKIKNYLGTGFIIDASGYILTNYSIIKTDSKIKAIIEGKEYDVDTVGEDRKTNLSLLKVKELSNFPSIGLADSDAVKVTDEVFIVANPFNIGTSASSNQISFRPKVMSVGNWEDFFQLSSYTSIYCGGAPLINNAGEVVGICDPRLENKNNIGFAIPSSVIKIFLEHVKKDRRMKRINVGFKAKDIDDYDISKYGLYSTQGLIIDSVKPATPASDLGLKQGDIITRFNGLTVKNKYSFEQILSSIPVGSRVDIDFIRNSRVRTLVMPIQELEQKANVLAEINKSKKREKPKIKTILGLVLEPITEELIKEYSLVQSSKGLVVTAVTPGSPAETKGIKAGDLIIKADSAELEKTEDLSTTLAEAIKGEKSSVLLLVIRKESSFFVVIDVK